MAEAWLGGSSRAACKQPRGWRRPAEAAEKCSSKAAIWLPAASNSLLRKQQWWQ